MVDKVLDFGKKLLERIKEWWNKFQPKQKTLIIGIGVVILLAITILVVVFTRKQYVNIVNAESTKEAAAVKELLEGQGLDYKVSSDGLHFDIVSTQQSDANYYLVLTTFQQQDTQLMMCLMEVFLQQRPTSKNGINFLSRDKLKKMWQA